MNVFQNLGVNPFCEESAYLYAQTLIHIENAQEALQVANKIIETSQNDNSRVKGVLVKSLALYSLGYFNEAESIILKVINSEKSPNKLPGMGAYFSLLLDINVKKNKSSAIETARRALQCYEYCKDIRGTGNVHMSLSDWHFQNNRYNECFNELKLAEKIYLDISYDRGLINLCKRMSLLFQTQGDIDKSVTHQEDAYKLSCKMNNFAQIIDSLQSLILLKLGGRRVNEAIGLINELQSKAFQAKDKHLQARSHFMSASVAISYSDYNYALSEISKSLYISRQLGDFNNLVLCLLFAANLYHSVGAKRRAFQSASEALQLIAEHLMQKTYFPKAIDNFCEVCFSYELAQGEGEIIDKVIGYYEDYLNGLPGNIFEYRVSFVKINLIRMKVRNKNIKYTGETLQKDIFAVLQFIRTYIGDVTQEEAEVTIGYLLFALYEASNRDMDTFVTYMNYWKMPEVSSFPPIREINHNYLRDFYPDIALGVKYQQFEN